MTTVMTEEKFQKCKDAIHNVSSAIADLRMAGYKVEVTLRDPNLPPDKNCIDIQVWKPV